MSRSKIIGAIEIGTSQVSVLVGEVAPRRALNILGYGRVDSAGVRKGEILEYRAACESAHQAIIAAERMAGASIGGMYLSVTGAHLGAFSWKGVVQVSSADDVVRRSDVVKACDLAKGKGLPAGRVYINHIRSGFMLDGRRADDPVGQVGRELEAYYWHVHGDEQRVRDLVGVVSGFGDIEIKDLVLASAASGTVAATDAEKQQGVLVVDFGCGTLDWACYKHGRIVKTGLIPVGGDHLTNDLALGLRIPGARAEDFKRQVGKAILDKEDEGDTVWLYGDFNIGDRKIPRSAVHQVLSLRVEETFSLLKGELGTLASRQELPAGVVLTGGSSRLQALPEAVRRVLGLDVRTFQSPDWVPSVLRQPEWSTTLGLLYLGLTNHRVDEAPPEERKPKGFLGKLSEIFAPSAS